MVAESQMGLLSTFSDGFHDLALFERDPGGDAGATGFVVLDPAAAADFVRRIAPWELLHLRGTGDRFASSLEHDRMLDELATLVRVGHVVLARRELPRGGFEHTVAPTDLADLAEPEPAESKPVETFAKFRLVDDGGKPIVDQAFTLDLPDGRTLDGVTGPDGSFGVDPVANPGNCVLRFAKAG
jgi:hypothetical protein